MNRDTKHATKNASARFEVPLRVPAIRSERAAEVARLFGLPRASAMLDAKNRERIPHPKIDLRALLPQPGEIVLFTGPSGAGKSSLVKRQRRLTRHAVDWIDLSRLPLANVPLVDCFDGTEPLTDVLLDLSRVGLGEAWSYLRTPRELSEGQRWRLRLAMAIRRATRPAPNEGITPRPPILIADEFAAMLDRVTAAVVARCLRRAIDATSQLAAVVATSHEDLIDALRPNRIVRCDFGAVEVIET